MKRIYKKSLVQQRQHLKLPDVVTTALCLVPVEEKELRSAYIYALRVKGWTLQAVADSLGVTRERVRQLETQAVPELVYLVQQAPGSYPVPELPTEEVVLYSGSVQVDPKPETLARLKELQPIAQAIRWDHTKGRTEAEEYTALLWEAHTQQGVSVYRLAKLLGITHGAIQFRFTRYGYKETKTGRSKAYKTIKRENRPNNE
jgi:transcriptional regulator with XRE-family HTH domain